MVYFLLKNVCDKIDVPFKASIINNMSFGRDYIKINNKISPKVYNYLINGDNSKSIVVLTLFGLFEMFYKCKTSAALDIKRKMIGFSGGDIFNSVAYKLVQDIVWNSSETKISMILNSESYALKYIGEKIGTSNLTEDTIRSVQIVRSLYNNQITHNFDTNEDVILFFVKEFNGFVID